MEFIDAIPMFGSVSNAVMIVVGGTAGLGLRKCLPPKIMELPVQGMALFTAALGISMAIKSRSLLIVIVAITIGAVVGELLDIEGRIERGAQRLEGRGGNSLNGFSIGFVAATVLYCTGSMAVLGSFEEGLGGYPVLLLTKGMLDGLMSVALAASLGFGVLLAALPVLIYQVFLTFAASTLQPFMSEAAVTEMSATGGLMLIAISLNLLGLAKIRVMNMIPGMVVAVLLAILFL